MGAYTFYIATAITFTAINLDQLTDLEHFQGKFETKSEKFFHEQSFQ